MAEVNETKPLLSERSARQNIVEGDKGGDEALTNRSYSTPVLGEESWNVYFWSSLMSVTFLSVWQNAAKVAMSLHLQNDPAEMFRKPLFIVFTQFAGLALYFPFSGFHQQKWGTNVLQRIALSAFLGYLTFAFLLLGLLFVPLSSAVVIRMGGQAFFTLIGTCATGKLSLNIWMVLAIAIVFFGVVFACVPLSKEIDRDPNLLEQVFPQIGETFGIASIILSAGLAATRSFLEEDILTKEQALTGVMLAATSNAFSSLIAISVLLVVQILPGADHGVQEDSVDSFAKIFTNFPLALTLLIGICAAAGYQLCDKSLVKKYGAASTKILGAIQIAPTWAIAVIIFYVFNGQGIGEAWVWEIALYKLIGSIFVLVGDELYLLGQSLAEKDSDPVTQEDQNKS